MKHVSLRRLNSSLPDDYDLFICSSSFEQRCLVAPQKLARKHFARVIVIENKYGSESIHQNSDLLLKMFGKKAQLLSIDYSNPLEIADKLLLEINFPSVECIAIPCDDPDEASIMLCELYKSHEEENLIVIPMNNKLSTIAVAKSIMTMDHVQACYAPAVVYNESNYSAPGTTCYIFEY